MANGSALAAEQFRAISSQKVADHIVFEHVGNVSNFRSWTMPFKRTVAAASGQPPQGFKWASRSEKADHDELEDSEGFPQLDAKMAAALSKIITGELARKLNAIGEQLSLKDEMLTGRHVAWHIFQHYRTTDTEGAVLEFKDRLAVELKSGSLSSF